MTGQYVDPTERDREYERTGHDPAGLYRLTPCVLAGHVPGCPGRAGGDHELRDGWIAYEDDGNLVEVEVTHA